MTSKSSAARALGAQGEALAARVLAERGYTLVGRNWRCEFGEIDLIMRQGETWVFIEVKSVRAQHTDSAARKVTRAKQRRIVRCIYAYCDAHQLGDVATRVDVIAIAFPMTGAPHIDHWEDILEFNLFSDDDS